MGGGRYEKEIFYRQCDALGLLVWQDVMFSDAFMLPTPDVMTEVKEELLWQARRLKNHSCIALWGGDNPIVDGIYQQLPNRQERDKYLSNYDCLMRNIRQVLEQEDPKRLFWVSASYYDDSEHCRPWQILILAIAITGISGIKVWIMFIAASISRTSVVSLVSNLGHLCLQFELSHQKSIGISRHQVWSSINVMVKVMPPS